MIKRSTFLIYVKLNFALFCVFLKDFSMKNKRNKFFGQSEKLNSIPQNLFLNSLASLFVTVTFSKSTLSLFVNCLSPVLKKFFTFYAICNRDIDGKQSFSSFCDFSPFSPFVKIYNVSRQKCLSQENPLSEIFSFDVVSSKKHKAQKGETFSILNDFPPCFCDIYEALYTFFSFLIML